MEDKKAGPAFNVSEVFGSSFQNSYDGICNYYCCAYQGNRYYYPSHLGDTAPKSIIACERHVSSFGFCYSCGKFAKSDRNFARFDGRLCDDCWHNHYYDWSRGNGWNDDDWEDLHNG